METVAIIVAAGRGLRAAEHGGTLPKQYSRLGNKPLLAHTLSAFAMHPRIDRILAVIHEDDRAQYDDIAATFDDRLLEPALGGARRQDSVRAGLEALEPDNPRDVLIHDAARPFVPAAVIDRVLDALRRQEAVVPACPMADTVQRAREGRLVDTVDRSELWRAQTPQGFRYATILEAHRAAAGAEHTFTDDAAVAHWRGVEVALVEGAESNRKLTTPEDFALAERLIGGGSAVEFRTGQGFDVHAFALGDHVMLCGVRVPHTQSLAGHSDADVGLHALTDALLGTIGDGDIGMHFPPSDPKWKNAASDIFLREAVARVSAHGGRIVHVDVTLLCEAPKIAPHRQAMQSRMAAIIGIGADRVSVKATTTEGLGFTGRREGIAAMATATVSLPC